MCEPPLSAKLCRDEHGGAVLWLIGSGASLLEGDELLISVALRDGARLAVRSVAAQLVHPCPDGGWGRLHIEAEVDHGASLWWAPEPTIVAGDAGFRADATVALAGDASLRWREELVLGRTAEDPASIRLDVATAVDADGSPCWRDGLASHPGWLGPAVLGPARYLGTELRLGPGCGQPDAAPSPGDPRTDGWLALAGGGAVRRVLDTEPADGRVRLGCR